MPSIRPNRGLAVVTGASSGLGEAFARELARRGHDLLLVARRGERLAKLCEELRTTHGCRAEPLVADLSRPEGPRAVLDTVDRGECPTLFVNNAGFAQAGPTLDASPERIVDMIRLNAEAVAVLTIAAARRMVGEKRGGVINVSSTAAFAGSPYLAVYGGTKGFQLLFSEALNEELAGTGVRVFALCPGYTETEFAEVANLKGRPPKVMVATAEQCAREGLDAYDAGHTVYVQGGFNKVMVFMGRLFPRAAMVSAAAKAFAPR